MLHRDEINKLFTGKKYSILDNKYALIQKVGSGATCIVKLARSRDNGEIVAVKILTKKEETANKHHIAEVSNLSKISHPNVVGLVDSGRGQIRKPNNTYKEVNYIVLEYACNGELFDYIYFPKKPFSEDIARYLFKSLLDGLESCHNAGVAHRDLKTENLMMDENWNLKIADFGYATSISGHKGTGLLDSYLGTISYVCPEILTHMPYMGTCSDIFSCGVILFVLVTGKMPFGKATIHDVYYKNFATCEYDKYWDIMTKRLVPVSEEFKGLINLLLAFDPTQRPSINEIRNHEWMIMSEPNQFDARNLINNEFENRKKIVTEMKLLEGGCISDNSTNISMDIDEEENKVYRKESRKCKDYKDGSNPYKFMLNCEDYKKVFCCLGNYFTKTDVRKKTIKPHDSMCKIEITYDPEENNSGSNSSIHEPLNFTITVKKTEKNQLMVEFCKGSGDKGQFAEIYEGFLKCVNSK